MKMEDNETRGLKKYKDQAKQYPRSADSLLNDEESSSEPEIWEVYGVAMKY